MQLAGFVNVVKTILIILFVYYLLKFLMRLLAPFILKKVATKMHEQANQRNSYQDHSNTGSVKEGETVIDKKPMNSKNSNNDVGEYVDFEEID